MERDALDFGRMNIPRLFIKLFVPTLLGLLFGALLNLADGIFVGRGVGSDALAAVNIAAPLFLVATGLALMFGAGVSVVAAIHLSRGNQKAANINVTQALTVSVFLLSVPAGVHDWQRHRAVSFTNHQLYLWCWTVGAHPSYT